MKTKGFTLVELLVVIAILAILATVSVVGYTSFIERAEESNAATEAHQVESAIESFLMIDGEYVLATAANPTSGFAVTKIYAKTVGENVEIWATTTTYNKGDNSATTEVETDYVWYTTSEAKHNGFITLANDSDFYELPGKLYSDNGTLLYVYEDAGVAGTYEADEDSAVKVFAN